VAGGAAFWFVQHRGPIVAKPGEPLPDGATVQLQFPADENGDAETWVVTKKETTREESVKALVGSQELPAPDAAAKDHTADDSARALEGQARDAWRGGDLDRAQDLYAKAVEADPDDWLANAHYGRLLATMRDDTRARPLLERAAALSPDDPQRWLDLQTLYEHTQEISLASEARQRASALAKDRPIVQDWAGFWTIEGSEEIP
ncbi:MAG TPA: tetratricopeptide repeat protein, partial [Myxococcota bacterium]|nr:tetratricopeptide repeat protein [Myxococcota bacterium]